MCKYCEGGKTNIYGQNMFTSLGDDVGIIHINLYLINKLESTEELRPSLGVDVTYKGERVFGARDRIEYCPFCGQKLR